MRIPDFLRTTGAIGAMANGPLFTLCKNLRISGRAQQMLLGVFFKNNWTCA
jgi:hypothetical protein